MARSKVSATRFLIGLGALAVVLVVIYVALTANQGHLPGTSPKVVRAAFADVGQLQAGNEVRQNGIVVGQVTSIDLVNDKPLVTMQLNDGTPMYRDGYAGVWDQSALAQKYVQLRAGHPSAGLLGDQVLPESQTESTHDIAALLDVFDPRTRAALSDSLQQLGGGLAGYGPGLHDFLASLPTDLTDVGTISATLVSDHTDLPGLLHSTDRLSERFTGREQQITELLAQTDATLRGLSVDEGKPLGDTLKKLPGALTAVRGALNDAEQPLTDLAVSTGQLRSGAHALGRASPDVRGVFRESLRPLEQLPGVADDAKPAVSELAETFSAAEPFAGKLAEGLTSAAKPVEVLAPYASDLNTFAFDGSSALDRHDGWEHSLRVTLALPGAPGVLPGVLQDTRYPYPGPGQAIRQHDPTGALIPGR